MDPTSSSPAGPRPGRFLPPLLIAVATFAAFFPALRGEFLNWDDDAQYLANPHYRGLGLQNLKWMFSDNYGHFMPLTWITHGLDYLLWGMNPMGYHLGNNLLHSLNAVLLFFLLRRLLRKARPDAGAPLIDGAAAVGALFFSIHPLRVESVAWLTERRDVLSCAFFLGTILTYVRMTEEPERRWKWLGLSTLCFAAMLLSKTMGLTLPVVLFVLDVYPLRRFRREAIPSLVREKIPFLVLMAASMIMVRMSVDKADAFYTREQYPLLQSVAQPGYRLSFYIVKTLLPFNLSPLYAYRPELGWLHLLGWAAILGTGAVLLFLRRRLPSALAAYACFGLLIAPVSGIVQVGPQFAADRYTYIPCLPFAALAAGAVLLLDRIPRGAFALPLAGLGILAFLQCAVWRDSVSLWTRAIDLEPDFYFSRDRRGQAFAALRQWDRALADYDVSIRLKSGWYESWSHRATARLNAGNPAGAIEDATRALQLQPDLGDAFNTRGAAQVRLGRSREAVQDFSSALRVRPRFVEARVHRATELAKLGDLAGALADFDEALSIDPQPQLYLRRATVRALQKDFEGTEADCTEALRLKPDLPDAYVRRGMARMERGRPQEAALDFEKALETAPAGWPARGQVGEFLRQARSTSPR